jgi:cystathionine beta-lyase
VSFDFDQPVSRTGTGSLKWDKYAGRDILPLWVADTDFRSPPAVIAALQARAAHGVFGYAEPPQSLIETTLETLQREFAWPVDPAWLVWLPGLVSGLSVTCRAVGKTGDSVAVMTPVYPPFLKVPALMDRKLATIPLQGGNVGGWTFSKERFAAGLDERTRLCLLCHPHNPVGRLWNEQELADLAEVCLSHRMIICSDEIHNQLILDRDRRHVPLATLGPEIAARTITLLAPSKAFNIAGLGCSLAVIPDEALRRRFVRAMAGIVPHVNVMGLAAAEAAWRHGTDWLAAQNAYLRDNRDYLTARIAELPGITMAEVEATYLAWLDISTLNLSDPMAHFEAHGLGLSPGRDFAGPDHMRLNFGCTRATLVEACHRLATAVQDQ